MGFNKTLIWAQGTLKIVIMVFTKMAIKFLPKKQKQNKII